MTERPGQQTGNPRCGVPRRGRQAPRYRRRRRGEPGRCPGQRLPDSAAAASGTERGRGRAPSSGRSGAPSSPRPAQSPRPGPALVAPGRRKTPAPGPPSSLPAGAKPPGAAGARGVVPGCGGCGGCGGVGGAGHAAGKGDGEGTGGPRWIGLYTLRVGWAGSFWGDCRSAGRWRSRWSTSPWCARRTSGGGTPTR